MVFRIIDPLEVPELGSLGKGVSFLTWKGLCRRWSQNEWSVQRGGNRGSRLGGGGAGGERGQAPSTPIRVTGRTQGTASLIGGGGAQLRKLSSLPKTSSAGWGWQTDSLLLLGLILISIAQKTHANTQKTPKRSVLYLAPCRSLSASASASASVSASLSPGRSLALFR